MKRTFAAVLAISMAVVWAGGCQEEQASSGEKKARLTAVENRDLQSQLQAEKKKRDDDIRNLNTQFQSEMKKKDDGIKKLNEQLKKSQSLFQTEIAKKDDETKKLSAQIQNDKAQFQTEMKKRDEDMRSVRSQLEQCENTRDERVAKEIDKQCEETVSNLMDWAVELSAEIEQLKAGQADVNGETDK